MVPVFRASRHIESLFDRIHDDCASRYSLELILVDDLSNDETKSVIKALIPRYPNISFSLISLRRNMGQTTATAIGLAHAQNEYIVTMDDDLQHHPKDIEVLFKCIKEDDLDFVVAKFQKTSVSQFKAVARRIAHRLAATQFRTPKDFGFSSFCMYQRSFIQSAELLSRPKIEIGWMFELSQRYANVPLEQFESVRVSSTHSLASLFRASKPLLRHLFSVLVRPIAALGLLSGVAALTVILYYLWFFISTGSVIPGFATLVILMLLSIGISGIFLFTAMTALRDIRSLVHERVMNSVGGIERTNQQ